MDHGWRHGVRWKEGEETWAGLWMYFFCSFVPAPVRREDKQAAAEERIFHS
jgi:hypothetical protein